MVNKTEVFSKKRPQNALQESIPQVWAHRCKVNIYFAIAEILGDSGVFSSCCVQVICQVLSSADVMREDWSKLCKERGCLTFNL